MALLFPPVQVYVVGHNGWLVATEACQAAAIHVCELLAVPEADIGRVTPITFFDAQASVPSDRFLARSTHIRRFVGGRNIDVPLYFLVYGNSLYIYYGEYVHSRRRVPVWVRDLCLETPST